MEKKLGRGAGGKECNEYWIDCIIIIIITTSFIYVWKWGEVWSGALLFVENERERESNKVKIQHIALTHSWTGISS